MTGNKNGIYVLWQQQCHQQFQIGKNGLENSVIDSARAALMARELIKVKLHNNSPEDKTIFQELADMLGAELVQVIGFNGVLYKAKKRT